MLCVVSFWLLVARCLLVFVACCVLLGDLLRAVVARCVLLCDVCCRSLYVAFGCCSLCVIVACCLFLVA